MLLDLNSEPNYTNEIGNKWFYYREGSNYANQKRESSKPLNAVAWVVEFPTGNKMFVLTKEGKVLAEAETLEGFGAKIDMLRLAQG